VAVIELVSCAEELRKYMSVSHGTFTAFSEKAETIAVLR
jgi:hypothetical protein